MTEREEMEAVLEAILFVAQDPMPRDRLLDVFPESERDAAEQALAAVEARYGASPGRGIRLDEAAGGLRLVTRPDLHDWLRRFFEKSSAGKLSMAALETLAIVAYRQPVTAPEIQELRSVSSSGVLRNLLEKRLVRISGRKEVVGKPFLYATTREFLLRFGLKSLDELPPLEQFEEMMETELGMEQPDPRADLEDEAEREVADLAERDEDEEEA